MCISEEGTWEYLWVCLVEWLQVFLILALYVYPSWERERERLQDIHSSLSLTHTHTRRWSCTSQYLCVWKWVSSTTTLSLHSCSSLSLKSLSSCSLLSPARWIVMGGTGPSHCGARFHLSKSTLYASLSLVINTICSCDKDTPTSHLVFIATFESQTCPLARVQDLAI